MSGQWSKTKSWPEGFRKCLKCFEIKSFEMFHIHKQGYMGHYTICKSCRVLTSKITWNNYGHSLKLYSYAKNRARRKGREFSITQEDVIIPEFCPVLKTKMTKPSIDRINNSKGYIPGNIQVISYRANMIKNSSTIKELELILEYMKKHANTN